MKKLIYKVREYIPLFSLIVYAITFISLILYVIILNSVSFANFFNYNLSYPTRVIMAWITHIFPFSVAEIFIILSPILLVLLIILIVHIAKKGKKSSIKFLNVVIAIACLIFVLFVWTYSSGYHTSKIEDKMRLKREEVSEEELYLTSEIFIEKLNELSKSVEYDKTGASVMPYSYSEMSKKICYGYEKFVEKNGVLRTYHSRVKPIILSEPMTYTHISGIYTFMSGEANINTNYPDFIMASTAAHEMAHQRGIAREDESNFISFAVLIETEDPFLMYSAYLDAYSTVFNDLYNTNQELYFQLVSKLDKKVLNDLISYSDFFEKYAESKASEVTESVNDSYLQANGQEEGTKSYGMITELICAYLLNIKN